MENQDNKLKLFFGGNKDQHIGWVEVYNGTSFLAGRMSTCAVPGSSQLPHFHLLKSSEKQPLVYKKLYLASHEISINGTGPARLQHQLCAG